MFTTGTNVFEIGSNSVVYAADKEGHACPYSVRTRTVWQISFWLAVVATYPLASQAQATIPDTNFLAITIVPPNNPSVKAAVAADGKILVQGGFETIRGGLHANFARINSDSSVDASFVPAKTGVPVVQADGKVLLNQFYNLRRLNIDGTLDSSFFVSTVATQIFAWGPGLVSFPIYSVLPQDDGKIYLSGPFSELKGVERNGMARLNLNGSVDHAFAPELGQDDLVHRIAVQSDRKVVLSRWYSLLPHAPISPVARLNVDGSLDRGFGTKGDFTGSIYSLAARSNGRILVGGEFTNFNGVERSGIVELNPDGTVASDANRGSGTGTVWSVLPLPDGKTLDRKSTRLNSSHSQISYAVFCLKKKK